MKSPQVKAISCTLLLAAALAASGVARAAQPISLLTPVTYEYETSVLDKTTESCKLEDKLASGIGGEIQKRAGRPGTTASTAGVVVRVVITGSGGFAGPFEGTCGILDGITETLATDIVGWTGTQTDAAFDTDVQARAAAAAQPAASDAQ